jgi:hypothetical protein
LRFLALRRLKNRAATNTGVASPGYAASPGFLSLLTLCSARNRSRLVSCGKHPWASAFRGFPFPVARTTSRRPCPSCRFSTSRPTRRTGPEDPLPRLQGFAHPGSPYRQSQCYPTDADRSSPSVTPLRGIHPSGLGFVLPRGLLSWAWMSYRAANRPTQHPLCRVSKSRRIGLSLSRTADLPEVCVVGRCLPKKTSASASLRFR